MRTAQHKHWLVILLLILMLLVVGTAYLYHYVSFGFLATLPDQSVVRLTLKPHWLAPSGRELVVEVVNTPESITRGLSYRSDLSQDGQPLDGLLFVFQEPQSLQFWMYEMLFAIDICWLLDLHLLACERSAPAPAAGEEPARYRSPVPVNFVLETNPGLLSNDELGHKLFFQWW